MSSDDHRISSTMDTASAARLWPTVQCRLFLTSDDSRLSVSIEQQIEELQRSTERISASRQELTSLFNQISQDGDQDGNRRHVLQTTTVCNDRTAGDRTNSSWETGY